MLNYLPRHDNKLGNGGIAPRNLNLDTGDDWSDSRPGSSNHGLTDLVPIRKEVGGPWTSLEAVTKRKRFYRCPYREMNPDRPARSLISIPTELPRLLESIKKLNEEKV
jgi:hypothetical protein